MNLTSVEQDTWSEIAEALRIEILKRLVNMHEMNVGDLHTFICCCRDAYWTEIQGKSFDKKLEKAKSEFDNPLGN